MGESRRRGLSRAAGSLCYCVAVNDAMFFSTFFELVEALARTTLTTTSKRLLMAYVAEAEESTLGERARSAIVRYIQKEVPSVDEIRRKSQSEELSKLDHLVLKMEYEANRVQ